MVINAIERRAGVARQAMDEGAAIGVPPRTVMVLIVLDA